MKDTTRTIFIALGVTLLVLVLLPLLFMLPFLFMGSTMGGMMGGMMGSQCCGGIPWLMTGLVVLALVAGVIFLLVGLRRR